MDTTARLDLSVWRNDDTWEFPLRVVGVDLSGDPGVALAMQVRLAPDTPGAPLINLTKVSTWNAEGLRAAGVTVIDGVPTTDLRIRINKSTRQALPYAGELGDSAPLSYALLIGGKTRLVGDFTVLAHTYGSDAAPASRPAGYGAASATAGVASGATLTIAQDGGATLILDGADLVGAIADDAATERQAAEAAAVSAGAARDQALAQAVLISNAAAGVYVPGLTLTPVSIELDGAGRVLAFRDSTGKRWYFDAAGVLLAEVVPGDLYDKLYPGGVYIPGSGMAVTNVLIDGAGRAVEFTDAANADWYYDASGVLSAKVTQAELAVKYAKGGVYVPGMPVPVVGATVFGDGRVGEVLGQDGKSYQQNAKGAWFAPADLVVSADYDVVIYATSVGGLMSALRAAGRGKRVCVIEPYSNFGGMHANGMTLVDTPDPANAPEGTIFGGLTHSVYFARVNATDGTRFTAQAKTYEIVAQQIIQESTVRAIRNEPIEAPRGVLMGRNSYGEPYIVGVWTREGLITAKQFIDASYEGDLMAAAVGRKGYTWGRESSAKYGESTAGFRGLGYNYNLGPDQGGGVGFQFYTGSGVVATPGYPFIGLPAQNVGDGDDKVQSYNFRLPLTRVAANRIPFIKPYGYDNRLYLTELQRIRNDGKTRFCRDTAANSYGWQASGANGKVNWNAADLLNGSIGYPDGNWTMRRRITEAHVLWQQGLMWCIANDPVARDYGLGALQDDANDTAGGGAAAIGLCADEFEGSQWGAGWPFWLYARETRRMLAMYVMREADITPASAGGTPTKTTSIGKWAYYPDIHAVQGLLAPGFTDRVVIEGSGNSHTPTATYQLPIEAMIPPADKCINLLVPVCGGHSHVAWAPSRLEIPFGYYGEAAGELAAWLCDNPGKRAQDFNYATIAARLTAGGSKL